MHEALSGGLGFRAWFRVGFHRVLLAVMFFIGCYVFLSRILNGSARILRGLRGLKGFKDFTVKGG